MKHNQEEWSHVKIRETAQNFFLQKQHQLFNSSSLIPSEKDQSLLFCNSGMVQFKEWFLDVTKAKTNRAFSIQKCVRAGGKHNDIDNVGFTKRHHTFFEMIGNFSFGDYFKEKAINYIWELLTVVFKIPKSKLLVTVHEDDLESFDLWQKHIDKNRIAKKREDNFWKMGDSGPCGPCTECFYDLEGENALATDFYSNEERFLEIWNVVFMESFDNEKTIKPLQHKSVDTGGGLERLCSVLQNKEDNFQTDLFVPIINKLKGFIQAPSYVLKICADHVRMAVMAISDNILPDRDGRGNVLRKIIRRAIKYYFDYTQSPLLFHCVEEVNQTLGQFYKINSKKAKEIIFQEEETYLKTLKNSGDLIKQFMKKTPQITGKEIFELYDSQGMDLDLIMDHVNESNHKSLLEEFAVLMNQHREKSSIKKTEISFHDFEFTGYDSFSEKTKVVSLLNEEYEEVERLLKGVKGFMFVEKSPFYAEGGGQVGDIGVGSGTEFKIKIIDTKKQKLAISYIHSIEIIEGSITKGDEIKIEINVERRDHITRHHSTAHLLGYAVNKIKGFCEQRGSLVKEDLCRIDFYCGDVSDLDLQKISKTVNDLVLQNLESKVLSLSLLEADEIGAGRLPNIQYSEPVRVINFGNTSIELCGGTHVKRTGDIGPIIITKCSGIGSNIKRIEAVSGKKAMEYIEKTLNFVKTLQEELKCGSQEGLLNKIKKTPIQTKKFQILSEKQYGEWRVIKHEGVAPGSFIDCILLENNKINIRSSQNKALDMWNEIQKKINVKGGGKPSLVWGVVESNEDLFITLNNLTNNNK